jgi:hypothetical protein
MYNETKDKAIPYIGSKKASLIGHFLWDIRSHPKI